MLQRNKYGMLHFRQWQYLLLLGSCTWPLAKITPSTLIFLSGLKAFREVWVFGAISGFRQCHVWPLHCGAVHISCLYCRCYSHRATV